MQRWMERLGEFDFTIEYKQGNALTAADTLSRICETRLKGEVEKRNRSDRAEKRANENKKAHDRERRKEARDWKRWATARIPEEGNRKKY
ncbi:hypothetical protein NEMIN01_2473 [Nematocida minor]|uniref:uncharacterized protein n=1 Tax=Nematocida minor TaxID=1912983 RepID=UPI00221F7A35|nr:uncharacterized protein NEMIN01_2473 [Nematocida minor]KAI5193317.1 hypothetical protein NEMIN01_2473 [Nematocida minor]